jgi:PBSX family phage terminase large subunit
MSENESITPRPAKHITRYKKKNKLTAKTRPQERRAQHLKDIEVAQQHIQDKKRKIESLDVVLDALSEDGSKVIETSVLDNVPPSAQKAILDQKIIWQPDFNNRPQIAFLEASEEEVMMSGARGSGKTDALIADPLRFVGNGNFKALFIRKSMKRLREVMSRARKIYLPAVPGTRWKEQEKMFVFPSGATIEFGYCDNEADLDQYIGQEYVWLGIDEITQYPTDSIIESLKQSLRTTDPTLKRMIRCTCNPGGAGHRWVKERFVNLGPPDTKITLEIQTEHSVQKITRKWIHSLTTDNTILMKNDPQYLTSLYAIQNETLKRQWLYGDWDAAEGAAFSEFNKNVHVIKPFAIPSSWLRFRACDWGYSSLAVCLWFAVDYDNNVYVYRELVENGNKAKQKLTAPEFARKVLQTEAGERVRYGILDCSTWSDRGQTGPSIAEEMINQGCAWRMSDGSKGSRIAGKMQVHTFLSLNPFTKKPKVFIVEHCKELIDELSSLPLDDNNPEDVDTDAQDHAYDAFRYGLMSRPQIANNSLWRIDTSSQGTNANIVVSKTFGY